MGGAVAGPIIGSVASGVVGGIFGNKAAGSAASAQRQANALNAQQFNYIKSQAQPWNSGGLSAYNALLGSFGLAPSFEGSQEYQDAYNAYNAAAPKPQDGLAGFAQRMMEKKNPR